MGVLPAGQAQAFVVTINKMQYDVTTFTGTYNDNSSKFATAANGGTMPWWGDSSLASEFAHQVGLSLGLPLLNIMGPFFGFGGLQYGVVLSQAWHSGFGFVVDNNSGFPASWSQPGLSLDNSGTWAQVSRSTSPASSVPGPLPVLGVAAAFGFSRKLRERTQGSGNAVSSTYSF